MVAGRLILKKYHYFMKHTFQTSELFCFVFSSLCEREIQVFLGKGNGLDFILNIKFKRF